MGKRGKIKFQGKEIEGEEVEFTTERDEWGIFKLSDGTTLKVKTIINKVIRTENYNEESGDPIYIVNNTPFIFTDVPENLKKITKTSN